MQSGSLTVTGEGKTNIVLSGRPREVIVHFKNEVEHVPCNPHHHHDHLQHHVRHEDEDKGGHKKPGHHHHDRQFFLEIEWRVTGIREICWIVIY
jgi:hypothetical protein